MSVSEKSPVNHVEMYVAPWVAGRRSTYMGPISVSLFIHGTKEEDWEDGELKALDMLGEKAKALKANSILGIEITMDPFALEHGQRGLRIHALGTAAHIEEW